MDFLFAAATQICSSLDLAKSLQRGLDAVRHRVPAHGVFVNIFIDHRQQIRFLAHATPSAARALELTVDLPAIYADALRSGRRPAVIRAAQIQDDPVTHWAAPHLVPGIASFVMVRLRLDNRHLGVAVFYSKAANAFTEEHADWLAQLHDPLALVTANALYPLLADRNHDLRAENAFLHARLQALHAPGAGLLVGSSPESALVRKQIEQVAPFDATVLIRGETGTGKEVIANAIHRRSNRAARPFVKVNCGAIPESLLDSELFGHERGAFTDAHQARRGYFEQADGGTLFLDEIGELSLSGQVRLLRALQSKVITRVGGSSEIKLDLRVIAATHRDLSAMVERELFREDLWYRLNVFPIEMPPLRERPSDIIDLVSCFLETLQLKYDLPCLPRLSPASLTAALRHAWPGNVRELENTLERALLRSDDGRLLQLELPAAGVALPAPANLTTAMASGTFDDAARAYLCQILGECQGRIFGHGGAAERAGLHPNTLRSRLKKLGISAASIAAECGRA
ncbi:MAG: sigma-54-dependent Fis family transcriptional regulator [Burkholderiaceae bacterium]